MNHIVQHDTKLLPTEYHISYKSREVMEYEINEMIELVVIEASISPYSSPIVLVPKKGGSVRFCTNFHNKLLEFDAEPIPNI